ncbi:G2/mitotic-specific cyclin-B3-like, partial [Nannospalax galili]|uniref:G2/mitotic-specific cyclin-B3-like n=1 Tax=Nannospalax galili TaxID=1026970 RepID=UPI0004ED0AC4
CKVQPGPTASSTTLLSDTGKQLTVDISSKSKTPTTEAASSFKKALVLNEETATEETTHINKTLKTSHGEMFLQKKPLTLLEETENYDEFDVEPMTFGKKYINEEAAIIEETMPSQKRCLYQETQSHQQLLFIKSESCENYYYLELIGLDEPEPQPEATVALRPLSLNSKCTVQGGKHPTPSQIRKSLFLKENPTTEKSLLQQPSSSQEKNNTQGEISILKKPQVLQENTNNEDDGLLEPVTFKRKHIAVDTTNTENLSDFKKKCNTQGKIFYFQSVTHENESFTNEPSFFKKSTTKNDFPFQCLSAFQEKHTTQVEASTVKKPQILQNHTPEEESQFQVETDFKKQCIMEEAPSMKRVFSLKKQQHQTQKKMFCFRPLVEEPITSEPPLKKPTTEKNSVSWGSSALQEKHIIPWQVSTLKKPLVLQKHPIEEESHFQEASSFKNQCIMEETDPTQKPLPLDTQQHPIQGTVSHLKNPLVLSTATSGEKSLIKEPFSFKEENMSLQKSKYITQINPTCPEQSEWLDIIDGDMNLFFTDPGSLREEPTTELLQEPSSLKETYSILKKVSPSKLLAAQEKTTSQKEAFSKEPVTSKEEPTDYYEFSPELFSPYSSENDFKLPQSLDLQEKTDTKNESPPKLLASQDSISEEEALFRKYFCRGRRSSDEESSPERTVAQEQEFLLMRELGLHDNSSNDGDKRLINHPVTFQEHSNIKKKNFKEPLKRQEKLSAGKMALLKKPLILQENPIGKTFLNEHTIDTEDHSQKCFTLQETPSIEKEATVKEILALLEKSRTEVVPVLKKLLVLLENPSMENKPLTSQENPKTKEESILQEVLALMGKSLTEKSTPREPLQQEPITKAEVTMNALKENPSTDKEARPQKVLSINHKSGIEKDIFRKTDFKKKSNTEAHFKETLSLNEKLTAVKKLSFQSPLALEENSQEEDSFLERLFYSQVTRKSNVSSNTLESRPGNSKTVNMSHVSKFNPDMKFSSHKSGSKNSHSSVGRILKEIGIEDSDTLEDSVLDDSAYVKEVFSYLKEREEKFVVEKYLDRQIEITSDMRAILVDWLVEIQVAFQMCHESLYLAVKLVDHYLMKVSCRKNYLQLLGSTAFMIAAKFEEPCPPSLFDFLYICENLYEHHEMIAMEIDILKTLNFDINIPTAYHFLRRFALSTHTSMRTLTLSRFICEMTLLEYDYTQEKPSKLAAASFLLALYMRNIKHEVPFLEYFSGYQSTELHPLVRKLNTMLTFQYYKHFNTVYEKYSEEAFFGVNKIPPLNKEELREILDM